MIAEWIPRRLGVVAVTSMPLSDDQNLDFFSYIELSIVSFIFEGKVRLG